MSAVVDYISDWRGRLQSRLYVQFRDDPSWKLWCTDVIGPQAQDLEDAGQTFLGVYDFNTAAGAQLDVIGRLVGQDRATADDPTYRIYLHARILTDKSSGTTPELYAIFGLLLGLAATGSMVVITDRLSAAFVLTINPPITDPQAQVALGFLRDAKDAGKRALLAWQEQPDAQTFTTALAASLSASVAIGASSLPITAVAAPKLPSNGQVTIDGGLTGAETLTYTAVVNTGGAFSLSLASTCANVHNTGATVELVGDPGLGWGDVNTPATGGQFAGEAQA
jgi:hypothetical protein